MLVDNLPLDEPVDLEEAGRVAVEDMTQSLDARLQDAEVEEARTLELNGQRVGVRLLLSSGEAVHFWVDDDELFWGGEDALAVHPWLDGLAPTPAERLEV